MVPAYLDARASLTTDVSMNFANSARPRGFRPLALASHCSSTSSTSSMSGMTLTGKRVSGQPQLISSGVKPITFDICGQ